MSDRSKSELFAAAKSAMEHAHAPYSKFPVGAALLSSDGAIHAGCNVENASYPEGMCAETNAIGHMIMAGGKIILEIAVLAQKKSQITPCGGCRQRLAEFGTAHTLVHLCDEHGVVETTSLGALLPKAFGTEVM